MAKLLDEIHPGEVLLEDFMKPLNISARKLSADIDVSPQPHQRCGQRPAAHYRRHGIALGPVFRHGAPFLAQPPGRVRHANSHARTSRHDRTANPGFQPA